MVTVVAVAEAGAVTWTPSATLPPPPETVSGDLAIESVGAAGVVADWRVKVTALEVPLPALLASVAVRTLAPALASVTLADQAPLAATVAEPIRLGPVEDGHRRSGVGDVDRAGDGLRRRRRGDALGDDGRPSAPFPPAARRRSPGCRCRRRPGRDWRYSSRSRRPCPGPRRRRPGRRPRRTRCRSPACRPPSRS